MTMPRGTHILPKPTGPTGPTGASGPTGISGPTGPAPVAASTPLAPLPITMASPYLGIGDYPEKAWQESLAANSPLRDELTAILKESAGVGVLAREQALKESSDGTDQTARQARNPLGLMIRSESEPYILVNRRKLRVFTTWAAAFTEHRRRLTDPAEAYQSAGVKTLGQFVERYLVGWVPGEGKGGFPPGETADSLALYKQQMQERIGARVAQFGRVGEGAVPPAPTGGVPAGFRAWDVPGLGHPLVIPDTITVRIVLTPKGVHRPGRVVIMTGSTLHETGNRGNSAGAEMHSRWQDGCTAGHPNGYVGVSMYVENRLLIVKIPFNENSIHSGDWRNNAHPSMEVCVNADRNAAQTEDTAMWVQAAILAPRGQNAKDHLYPHHASGCPAIINGQGRWPAIERGVQERIAVLQGAGPLPPAEIYAEAKPIPKVWDGTDYRREDGQTFVALQRVFVTRKVTAARQSADPAAKKVRRDLPAGEALLAYYVTRGTDGKTWIVSQFGSRVVAEDCLPALDSFDRVQTATADRGPWFPGDAVEDDPERGLSAADVPDDAPALTKGEFMQGAQP